MANGKAPALSAGTQPAKGVNSVVVKVTKKVCFDSFVPAEDRLLEDPEGNTLVEVWKIRDIIKELVEELIKELDIDK